ncbi:MAG TPA: hypothetical protein VGJ25_00110 [Gaiellaceae bacterium]
MPSGVERLVKSVLRRRAIDAALDRLRFALDTFPQTGPLARFSHSSYQPLPWLGLADSKRAGGSRSRWLAIEGVLDELDGLATAADLGANYGFFTIELARRGLATVAVESGPSAYRTALYALRRTGVRDAGVLVLELGPGTIELLPRTDVVLFLSLWHHLVRDHGPEQATRLVRELWAHTGRVLFFDTGESEMPSEFRLPRMEPDGRTWLEAFLRETCAGGEVRYLGLHDAFDADGAPARRNLFAVVR